MTYNIKMAMIASLVTGISVGIILSLIAAPSGIPQSWNSGITGGLAGAIGMIVGQKLRPLNKQDLYDTPLELGQRVLTEPVHSTYFQLN